MYQPGIGLAVKCAVGRLARRAVKSAWVKQTAVYPNSPTATGPTSRSYSGPPFPLDRYRQTKFDVTNALEQQLGRPPTKDEKRAAMAAARAAAAAAGNPLVKVHPDNNPGPVPPSLAHYAGEVGYPFTLNDTEQQAAIEDFMRKYPQFSMPTVAQQNYLQQHVNRQWSYDWETSPARLFSHPINPNASIRNLRQTDSPPTSSSSPDSNFDPRKPEKYNALLPRTGADPVWGTPFSAMNPALPPNAPLTQDQMDAMRRDYYTRNPSLVPVPGQPGYQAWVNQNMRGR